MKSIGLSEDSHRRLVELRMQEGKKTAEDLINTLIIEYKKKKFLEASNLFNKGLKQSNTSFENLLKTSSKIKEEISNEWF